MATNKKQYTNKAKPAVGGGKRSKKSKTKKGKMAKDEAWCPKCKHAVKMSNIKETTTKNNRKMLKADGSCGHTVYRFA